MDYDDINVGDLVDVSRFGYMFVVDTSYDDYLWVSDNPDDVARGMGNTIPRNQVDDIILTINDDPEDWEDFFDGMEGFEDYDWESYLE